MVHSWSLHAIMNPSISKLEMLAAPPPIRSIEYLAWSYHSYQLMMNTDPSESKLCSCKLEYKQQNRQLLTTWTKKSDKNILWERESLMTHPKINFFLRWSSCGTPEPEEFRWRMLNYSYKFWSPILYHENMKAWMFSSDTIVLPASGVGQ